MSLCRSGFPEPAPCLPRALCRTVGCSNRHQILRPRGHGAALSPPFGQIEDTAAWTMMQAQGERRGGGAKGKHLRQKINWCLNTGVENWRGRGGGGGTRPWILTNKSGKAPKEAPW